MNDCRDSGTGDLCLPAQAARQLCAEVLGLVGVDAAEAGVVADVLVDASLRGVDSHGLALLPTFVERICSGQMQPGRQWVVRRETAATALCDGQHGLGPVLAGRAADLAAHKARGAGAACVVLRDGNYVGALGYYVRRLAEAGCVALAAANATPRVAPHGGRGPLHGTNPLAWAAPVAGAPPLVFDAATGYPAARVARAAAAGQELPAGVALDREGRPTRDAAAAAAGILLPVGGHLGYGLGLLVDVLTGGLAAAPTGPGVPPVAASGGPYGCTFTVVAIDPGALGGAGPLAAATAGLAAAGRAVPADGEEAVRLPGDRAAACRARRLEEGIPVLASQWAELERRLAACRVGLDPGDGGAPRVTALAGDRRNS